jgi:toxin ParE1/3/4
VTKLRAKCRVVAKHPEIGDERSDLGENVRSTYVGNYVIFFRLIENTVEIARVIRGDLDTQGS